MAGLTSTGFTPLRESEIVAELQAIYRERFGSGTNVDTADPDSVPGQLIAIQAQREALLWELGESVYAARDPAGADGVPLDVLASLVVDPRRPATPTTVEVTLSGTAGKSVPAGKRVADADGNLFTLPAFVIGAGGTVASTATAVVPGPLVVPPTTLTVIVDTVAGWTGVTNAAAGTTGDAAEVDAEVRQRIESSSSVSGSATVAAIAARLGAIAGAQSATVTENATPATVDGIPAHAFEPVLYPDTVDEDEIARILHEHKPAGIQAYGDETATYTDEYGTDHDYGYTWATEVPQAVTVTLTQGPNYPDDGDDQVEEAVLLYYAALEVGEKPSEYGILRALPDIDIADAAASASPALSTTPTHRQIMTCSGVTVSS